MKAAFVVLGVLMLAVVAWVTLTPQSTANLLIEDAIATRTGEGDISIVMGFNNQGVPDRLVSVASAMGDAAFDYPGAFDELPVPLGRSSLAMDAAHIRVSGIDGDLGEGTLLPLTLTFEIAGEVAVKARLMAAAADPHAGHNMAMMDMDGPAPSIAITASPEQNGWRVAITVEDFTFSQEQMGEGDMPGVGHGHIYVGGIKLGRVFEPTYLVGQLPSGDHVIRVTLNTNNHRAYQFDGKPISATTRITVD